MRKHWETTVGTLGKKQCTIYIYIYSIYIYTLGYQNLKKSWSESNNLCFQLFAEKPGSSLPRSTQPEDLGKRLDPPLPPHPFPVAGPVEREPGELLAQGTRKLQGGPGKLEATKHIPCCFGKVVAGSSAKRSNPTFQWLSVLVKTRGHRSSPKVDQWFPLKLQLLEPRRLRETGGHPEKHPRRLERALRGAAHQQLGGARHREKIRQLRQGSPVRFFFFFLWVWFV